ncbi:MAG: ACT domain-containing protein [Micromonosporaceae bacterium]|nr:ACT domain-containing protein [Micromonosporaceae bacterium]
MTQDRNQGEGAIAASGDLPGRLELAIAGSPFSIRPGRYYLCRAAGIPRDGGALPEPGACASGPGNGACASGFGSLAATLVDELEHTRVVRSDDWDAAPDQDTHGPLSAIRIDVGGPDSAPGLLGAACTALAEAEVSVFVLSTFSSDYVLVGSDHLPVAVRALLVRGFPAGSDATSVRPCTRSDPRSEPGAAPRGPQGTSRSHE